MLEAHDKEDEKSMDWARTIHVSTGRIPTTRFNLSQDEKTGLYNSGYEAASRYLRSPQWQSLVGPPPVAEGIAADQPTTVGRNPVFESAERLSKAASEHADRIFQAIDLRRTVRLTPPDAVLEVYEELVNASENVQTEVVRVVASDTRTDVSKLGFQARFKIEGEERKAAVDISGSPDSRSFVIRMRFPGGVVQPKSKVELRWECRFPGSVAMNEDYWVFPVFFDQGVGKMRIEALFPNEPTDYRLLPYDVEDVKPPLGISGPERIESDGKNFFKYHATIFSPSGLYVLEWRLT
jgi:hypothetical protein